MPAEELDQGAVDLVLAHIIFNCQTAVIGAADEVRPALDSAEDPVVDIHQAPGKHHKDIQTGIDRVQHFAVYLDPAGPFPEGPGGEIGEFLCDKLVKLHGDHFIREPFPASLRNYKLNCFMFGKLLENRQAGNIGTGQLDC